MAGQDILNRNMSHFTVSTAKGQISTSYASRKKSAANVLHQWRKQADEQRRHAPHEGFICKLGVKVFTERGRRRRPTLLNRMWSEAQLAVSNAYKHRPRRGRTACWVVWYYGYAVIRYAPKPCTSTTKKSYNRKCHSPSSRTAYSVTAYRKFRSRWSLHMRLSNIGPLRGPMYVIVFTPKLRMNHA